MAQYKREKYAILATDVVIFTIKDGTLQVLLIKTTKKELKGSWAIPGGLIDYDESLKDAAKKHLKNKTGLTDVYLEQLETFGAPNRDPFGRVVSVAYFALIPPNRYILKTSKNYSDIKWVPFKSLPELAYDHEDILFTAVARLRSKLEYTNIVQGLLPARFTLSNLQETYEIILGKQIDKRNFRKKVLALKVVKETNGVAGGEAHRPAKLYAFTSKKPQIIQIL